MHSAFSSMLQLATRRSRSGQSILIVAFAFIVLIAFVGIATDVGLLFVRYSTLRRSVDAAAIAVAGQVRQGVDFARLNSIARQFLALQGAVNPDTVKVETCETDISRFVDLYKARNGGNGPTINPIDLLLDKAKRATDPIALAVFANDQYEETVLCKRDPQKLVRVSAQMYSRTAFLGIIGWTDVMLVASAISQTAALDVALLIDTSESMSDDTRLAQHNYGCTSTIGGACLSANDTKYSFNFDPTQLTYPTSVNDDTNWRDNQTNNFNLKEFKPFRATTAGVDPSGEETFGLGLGDPYFDINDATPAPATDTRNLRAIRNECMFYPDSNVRQNQASNFAWGGCCNDPTVQGKPGMSGELAVGNGLADEMTVEAFNDPTIRPDHYVDDSDETKLSATINSAAILRSMNNYNEKLPINRGKVFDANDPTGATTFFNNGDQNYSDLVCMPFKQVRDAARRFIKRLDFVRGDRLVLVTFDRDARLIYPSMKMDNGKIVDDTTIAPVIQDRDLAIKTLNFKVGVVRSWSSAGGYQTGCLAMTQGSRTQYSNTDVTTATGTKLYKSPWAKNPLLKWHYWTVSQCPTTNTGGGLYMARNALKDIRWIRRDAVWIIVLLTDGYANRTPSIKNINYSAFDVEPRGAAFQTPNDQRNWVEVPVENRPPNNPVDPILIAQYCEPGVKDETQPPGSEWTTPQGANYGQRPWYCDAFHTEREGGNNLKYSFGFCPWYTFCINDVQAPECIDRNNPGVWNNPAIFTEPSQPYCADNDANSRHFCANEVGQFNAYYTDKNDNKVYEAGVEPLSYCDPNYDADDYARDQADWAGLIKYADNVPGDFIGMFTIFFAKKTSTGQEAVLNANILGVKLARYIADAGDNGQIDDPLQQWYRQFRLIAAPTTVSNSPANKDYVIKYGISDGVITNVGALSWYTYMDETQLDLKYVNASWYKGSNDPCEPFNKVLGTNLSTTYTDYDSLDLAASLPRKDCGQYWFASDITKVNRAFSEIAGRLFTRLSR